MGIEHYSRWLQEEFPESWTSSERRVFDHVYFDLNEFLHTASRKASDEKHLFKRFLKDLSRVLRVCVARKSIFLALDGPAPLAKLITQRKRRLQHARKLNSGGK